MGPAGEWDDWDRCEVGQYDVPRGPAGFPSERRMTPWEKLSCFYQTGTEDGTAYPSPATMRGLADPFN